MWNKPWTYKESIAICVGLVLVGVLLQISIGPINWDLFAAPVNIIVLVLFLAAIVALHCLRKRIYAVRWATTAQAAVPVVIVAGLATVIYGITSDRSTLSAWPFVLLYVLMATILGLACLKHWKNVPFLLNHLGLFVALICATLGNADMQRLRMTVMQDTYEWRALDDDNKVHELDLAIQLNHFAIEEYPPKLVVISNETGKMQPVGAPATMLLEDSVMTGSLLGHTIKVLKVYQYCAQFADKDTVNFVPWSYSGATTAALVSVDGKQAEWVSNGSYMFPYKPVRINDSISLVMPECEPKCYTSNVNILTKSGAAVKEADIEVNKPLEIEGWKIYQLSYDNAKGRWSDISVLELVKDSWLPFVYAGIFVMLAGAVWMFVTAGGRKHD